jgi:hypothetical protein
MNQISYVFAAAVVVCAFGCKKKSGACAQAIDHSSELAKADMQKMPGMTDQMMQKMKDVAIQHCKDDKWPDDAIQCMIDAKTETDAQACYGKLSQQQRESMNHAARDAMKSAAGAGNAGGSAAMGSAMGSGSAAGSAATAPEQGSGSAGSAAPPK